MPLRATPHGCVETDWVQYQALDRMSCISSHGGPVSQLAGLSGMLRRACKAGSEWRKDKSTVHREADTGVCRAGPARSAGTRGGVVAKPPSWGAFFCSSPALMGLIFLVSKKCTPRGLSLKFGLWGPNRPHGVDFLAGRILATVQPRRSPARHTDTSGWMCI